MAAEQKKLQDLSDSFQSLQTQLQEAVDARQKLEAQRQENQAVQKEFGMVEDDSSIYKLVGPVLLKQEKTEAVEAVNRRLEFIDKEIIRMEKQIADLQAQSEGTKMEIIQIQQQQQQPIAQAAA